VYGRAALEAVAASGEGAELRVLRVELDADTDEPATLAAIVKAVRGRHDYGAVTA
jgi:hypothetical protein